MGAHPRPLSFLLRHFPRGHLTAGAALAALVTFALILPESGASSGEAERNVRASLELPPPEERTRQAGSEESAGQEEARLEWKELEVRSGDTLARLLGAQGVPAGEVHRLVTADERLKKLARIRPGETLRIGLDEQGTLQALEYRLSRVEALHANKTEGVWQAREEVREYERQLRYTRATIDDSLFMAGQRAGMSTGTIMQLARIFGWDIDFIMDIRKGDEFQVLYEELFLDGEKVGEGNIVTAEFHNRGREIAAFRYELSSGDVDYFDFEGNSMRREFIRNPVDFTRISSRFNPNRRHPVLNTMRAHRGVDYAAPTGTPVRAAGDGRVEYAGRRGGYGNVVIIRHGQKYSTLYAHLNRFHVRTGARVRQGQTIGTVGMTGMATGPHLHYEFRVNGQHRDPLRVELPQADALPREERRNFLVQANRLRNRMALHREAFTLAQNTE